MIAIIRRGSATPDALRMCTCSGFAPASRRKRMFERSDWNEPQFDADEMRLRRGNEPHVVVLVAIEVLVEMRKVRATDERLPPGDRGWVDLGEPCGDLEIDYPRDERALERSARAAQHVEARARELRSPRDVEDPERLAQLPVRPGNEIELLRLVLPDHGVVVLVLAAGDAGVDLVRYPEELLVPLGFQFGELRLQRLDPLPHLAHAGLHFVARRPAAARLVPLGVERLHVGSQLAGFSVGLEDPVERRVEAARA